MIRLVVAWSDGRWRWALADEGIEPEPLPAALGENAPNAAIAACACEALAHATGGATREAKHTVAIVRPDGCMFTVRA